MILLEEPPSEWPLMRLADACDLRIGKTPARGNHTYWQDGRFPWVAISDLNGGVLSQTEELITERAVEECRCKPVEPGTLLFSFKLTIGKIAFAGVRLFTNEAIAALPVKPGVELDSTFLALALRVVPLLGGASDAAKGTTLNKDSLSEIQIPVPSLAEQRRIVGRVEALTCRLEEAHQARQSASAEAGQAYAAALAAVFTALDDVPSRPLGEIAGIIGGNSIPENAAAPVSPTDRVGLMKVSDMNAEGNESVVTRCRLETFAAEAKRRKLRVLPPGAVVFPKRGGAIATNKKRTLAIPAALDPNMMGVFPLPGSGLESTFLRWWFESIDLASLQEDGGIPQVNKKHLDPLDVPLPDPIEQRRIVARLDALRAKVDELQRLQREVEAELAAFTPALLAKAFRGEL